MESIKTSKAEHQTCVLKPFLKKEKVIHYYSSALGRFVKKSIPELEAALLSDFNKRRNLTANEEGYYPTLQFTDIDYSKFCINEKNNPHLKDELEKKEENSNSQSNIN